MEKFDGLRVFWDGKRLQVKNSTPIDIPQEFAFPTTPFEGQLW
jgi:hypothetical protein